MSSTPSAPPAAELLLVSLITLAVCTAPQRVPGGRRAAALSAGAAAEGLGRTGARDKGVRGVIVCVWAGGTSDTVEASTYGTPLLMIKRCFRFPLPTLLVIAQLAFTNLWGPSSVAQFDTEWAQKVSCLQLADGMPVFILITTWGLGLPGICGVDRSLGHPKPLPLCCLLSMRLPLPIVAAP